MYERKLRRMLKKALYAYLYNAEWGYHVYTVLNLELNQMIYSRNLYDQGESK